MSDSDAATLNADQNCLPVVPLSEQVREKWKRVRAKKDEVLKEPQQEKKYLENVLGLQNGINDSCSPKGLKCPKCCVKFHSDAELSAHLKSDHITPVIQTQKSIKVQAPKAHHRRNQYFCVACKGKGFPSQLSYHRHLLLHVSLPQVKLTRIVKVDEKAEASEDEFAGRIQVARKRITVSCHSRSPLKFRLKCTNVQDGKDSFKIVKSSVRTGEKSENSVSAKNNSEDIPEDDVNRSSVVAESVSVCKSGVNAIESYISDAVNDSVIGDQEPTPVKDDEGKTADVEFEAETARVQAIQDQSCAPLEDESTPDSSENSKDFPTAVSKDRKEELIMRQMKNVESEMEKMQSKSPAVHNSHEPSNMPSVKNGLSVSVQPECESLEPEFIPIERLDKDGPPPLISATGSSLAQPSLSQIKASEMCAPETHILCEACGETILGDQTSLEDHCLCRGHYKCPICSVACASTDALAIHSKESHPNVDISSHLTERKKKSTIRTHWQKHVELAEKDSSRDSLSDLSNSPSIPSPSADIHTPPLPSPTAARVSEPLQSLTQSKRVAEAIQSSSRALEQDSRQSSPSVACTTPSEVTQAVPNYPAHGSSQHPQPQARLPPSRLSESMPPPLMRPANVRNSDNQPRATMPTVTMQPPPALYKMPTTHGISTTQPAPALPSLPNAGFVRGIPASGYQRDLQAAPVANSFASSASNHLAAALNARYQSMHHGYPPGSQAQPNYAPYPQPVQTQQRYPMGPPPPYPNQLSPHLQQNPRAPLLPQNAYSLASSQQAYNHSLLKAQLEQARMQLPQSSAMLQSMQNLQQEHYQQQQLQQQLFQQQHHQIIQPPQPEQSRPPVPPPPQNPQKRKNNSNSSSQLRYHHQTTLQNQQQLQNQLQQSGGQPPAKQRRQQRDNIGIPSKQTDSDCEIIAVQQRGEGVPVIHSIQGANASTAGDNTNSGSDGISNPANGNTPVSSESTIHLTDSITLSVRPTAGSNSGSGSGQRGSSANAVASILATRGITVTPASGATPSRSSGGQQKARPSPPLSQARPSPPLSQARPSPPLSQARPSPPLNQAQASSSSCQPPPLNINSAISISHSSRQPQLSNDGFAVPAPVAPQRPAQRQPPTADRPPRPPTVDLTDENALAQAANNIITCRLCDKQFPSPETLQQHMHVIHQTRNYFRCSICNTKHPSQQALSNHIKRVHKFGGISSSPPELVIPLVDLKNTGSMSRLSSLGVNYVISLNQLGMNPDSGMFCIPIMSLDSSGQARNNSISGLMSMGTAAVLPIGPVKSLPTAQQHSQQPTPPPQAVPSQSQGNVNLPPLTPLRTPTHQYMPSTNQVAPN